MKGMKRLRCRPPSYRASGWRLLVATSVSPRSHSLQGGWREQGGKPANVGWTPGGMQGHAGARCSDRLHPSAVLPTCQTVGAGSWRLPHQSQRTRPGTALASARGAGMRAGECAYAPEWPCHAMPAPQAGTAKAARPPDSPPAHTCPPARPPPHPPTHLVCYLVCHVCEGVWAGGEVSQPRVHLNHEVMEVCALQLRAGQAGKKGRSMATY
jgi:hypothetical protein